MAEPGFPLINDAMVSWARVKLQHAGEDIAGQPSIKGYRAISWKTMVERTPIYGEGRKPLGFTDGKVSFEASATYTAEGFWTLRDSINGGDGYMDKPLTLTVSFKRAAGNPIEKVTIQVKGMKESGAEPQEGSDGIEYVIPFDVVDIEENDKSPVEEIQI